MNKEDLNTDSSAQQKPEIPFSGDTLKESSFKVGAARNQLADCAGCADKPHKENAESHQAKVLVTKAELEKIKAGTMVARCPACSREFKARVSNAKTLKALKLEFKDTELALDNKECYELNAEQIKLLEAEREFCIEQISRAFLTKEKAMAFLRG